MSSGLRSRVADETYFTNTNTPPKSSRAKGSRSIFHGMPRILDYWASIENRNGLCIYIQKARASRVAFIKEGADFREQCCDAYHRCLFCFE